MYSLTADLAMVEYPSSSQVKSWMRKVADSSCLLAKSTYWKLTSPAYRLRSASAAAWSQLSVSLDCPRME